MHITYHIFKIIIVIFTICVNVRRGNSIVLLENDEEIAYWKLPNAFNPENT